MKLLVVLSVLVAGFVGGCSSSDSPSGPETIVGDLHITGSYFYVPTPSARSASGALVVIRDGSSSGPVVSGLTVKVNDYTLEFNQAIGYYVGTAPNLTSGDDVTIRVSDGLGSVAQTVQVPYIPSNLQLTGGVWDTSWSWSTNTITWTNPVVLGQAIAASIYDYGGVNTQRLYWATSGFPHYESISITNYEMLYYTGITSILALVGQANYADFPNNPSGSRVVVLAAAVGNWPVSGA